MHLGYTITPRADCGWIGEAGPGPSYADPGSRDSGQRDVKSGARHRLNVWAFAYWGAGLGVLTC